MTCIKLPSLNMLSCLFAGDHYHKFRDLSSKHPLVELRHDLLNVRLDLVVG